VIDIKLESTPWSPRQPLKFEPTSFVPSKPELSPIFEDDHMLPKHGITSPKKRSPDELSRSKEMEGICHDKPLHKEPILQFLEKQNQLTEILAQQHQQSLLPRLHLSKFTNDPLDFNTFMRGFQSQVEARTQSSEVCLQYLEQYLEGEAKDLIKGCLHKNPDLGYREAKDLLKAKYGDPYRVSNGYITKVNDWPILKPGDDSALECLSNFLTQCVSAMESLSYLSILDHPQNLQTLVKKLPIYLQDRWRRQAIRMRKPNECLPKFKHFAEFIDTEAKIATDPIFQGKC